MEVEEEATKLARKTITILMLPWLAHGHISPFLELAKKLSRRNFHIYFCSTPINLKLLEKRLGKNNEIDDKGIVLVEYHLPCLPNLPPHYHTTNGLPPHLMQTLKDALDLFATRGGFSDLLESRKPDLVIYDFIQSWAPPIALSHNIPAVQFQTLNASTVSYYTHFLFNGGPDSEYPFPELIISDFYKETLRKMNSEQANQAAKGSWKMVLIKTSRGIEGKYLDHLSNLIGKKVVPVGPLIRDEPHIGEQQELLDDEGGNRIMKWLDSKEPNSTMFVSFGSEYFCTDEEVKEIARGLELCNNVNFIWVIRFPLGEGKRADQVLPEGFTKRVGERGFIAEGWAAQMKILKHRNVGGFLSHCGWSSVLESMKVGIPIIAMPMQLDQPVNARLVETLGNGLEVMRDVNGKYQGEEIARVIKKVMEGEKFSKKAKELSNLILKKGDDDVDAAAEQLVEICGEFNKLK